MDPTRTGCCQPHLQWALGTVGALNMAGFHHHSWSSTASSYGIPLSYVHIHETIIWLIHDYIYIYDSIPHLHHDLHPLRCRIPSVVCWFWCWCSPQVFPQRQQGLETLHGNLLPGHPRRNLNGAASYVDHLPSTHHVVNWQVAIGNGYSCFTSWTKMTIVIF